MGINNTVCVFFLLILGPCSPFRLQRARTRGVISFTLSSTQDCFTSVGGDSLQEFMDTFKSSLRRETFVGLRLTSRKVALPGKKLDLEAMKGALSLQQQEDNTEQQLSTSIPINDDLVSINGRLVNMKAGIHLHLNAKFKTNDQAKNFAIGSEASSELLRLLTKGSFRKATLLTENANNKITLYTKNHVRTHTCIRRTTHPILSCSH